MYRDASAGRKERAAARHRDLRERVSGVLAAHRYGRRARAVVTDALARAVDTFALAHLEEHDRARPADTELDAAERALDALDDALASFPLEATRERERAERFRALGQPSEEAELFGDGFAQFRFAGNASAGHRRDVGALLLFAAARWTAQMTTTPLVDPHPDALALYFEQEGVPLRLDIEAASFDDGDLYDRATLRGLVAPAGRGDMAIRPQTMGDDILASLRIRRDITFGDDFFDATYFVSGDESDLRALLGPATRGALNRLARESPATVHVTIGIATMPLERAHSLASAAALMASLGRRGA